MPPAKKPRDKRKTDVEKLGVTRCRFCPDKPHSKKCGKCKPCCDADGYAATIYHRRRRAA